MTDVILVKEPQKIIVRGPGAPSPGMPAGGVNGDWVVKSLATPYLHTHMARHASNVPYTPSGTLAGNNVQAVIEEIETDYLAAVGANGAAIIAESARAVEAENTLTAGLVAEQVARTDADIILTAGLAAETAARIALDAAIDQANIAYVNVANVFTQPQQMTGLGVGTAASSGSAQFKSSVQVLRAPTFSSLLIEGPSAAFLDIGYDNVSLGASVPAGGFTWKPASASVTPQIIKMAAAQTADGWQLQTSAGAVKDKFTSAGVLKLGDYGNVTWLHVLGGNAVPASYFESSNGPAVSALSTGSVALLGEGPVGVRGLARSTTSVPLQSQAIAGQTGDHYQALDSASVSQFRVRSDGSVRVPSVLDVRTDGGSGIYAYLGAYATVYAGNVEAASFGTSGYYLNVTGTRLTADGYHDGVEWLTRFKGNPGPAMFEANAAAKRALVLKMAVSQSVNPFEILGSDAVGRFTVSPTGAPTVNLPSASGALASLGAAGGVHFQLAYGSGNGIEVNALQGVMRLYAAGSAPNIIMRRATQIGGTGDTAVGDVLLTLKLAAAQTADSWQQRDSADVVQTRFDSAGRLAIGNSFASTLSAKLTAIDGNIAIKGSTLAIDTIIGELQFGPLRNDGAYASLFPARIKAGFATSAESTNWYAGSFLSFWTHPGSDITASPPTERVRIDRDGRVGIGIGAPTAQLHTVVGAAATIGQIIKLAAAATGDAWQVQNSAAAVLAKLLANGEFQTVGNIVANLGVANQISMQGTGGGTGLAGFTFGTGLDTTLYRVAANSLKTDDLFGVNITPTAQLHVQAGAAGTVGQIIKLAAGATANGWELRDSADAIKAKFGSAGLLTLYSGFDVRGGNSYIDANVASLYLTSTAGSTTDSTAYSLNYMGTNANRAFYIRTNGADRIEIQGTGLVVIPGSIEMRGNALIGNGPGDLVAFYGKAPIVQPAALGADAVDLPTALVLLNNIKNNVITPLGLAA